MISSSFVQTGTATSSPADNAAPQSFNIVNVMLWMQRNANEESTIKKVAIIERNCDPLLKKLRIEKKDIHQFLRWIGYCLDDYNALVGLSKRAKALMESGVINFDVIKEGTLLSKILAEYSTAEELSSLWNLDISDT